MSAKLTKAQKQRIADWLTDRAAELRAEAHRLGGEASKLEHAFYGKANVDEIMKIDEQARDLRWESDECSARARALVYEAGALMGARQ